MASFEFGRDSASRNWRMRLFGLLGPGTEGPPLSLRPWDVTSSSAKAMTIESRACFCELAAFSKSRILLSKARILFSGPLSFSSRSFLSRVASHQPQSTAATTVSHSTSRIVKRNMGAGVLGIARRGILPNLMFGSVVLVKQLPEIPRTSHHRRPHGHQDQQRAEAIAHADNLAGGWCEVNDVLRGMVVAI